MSNLATIRGGGAFTAENLRDVNANFAALAPGMIFTSDVVLGNDDILTLATVGFQLIPGAGDDRYISWLATWLQFQWFGDYSAVDSRVVIRYGDTGSDNTAGQDILNEDSLGVNLSGFMDAGADRIQALSLAGYSFTISSSDTPYFLSNNGVYLSKFDGLEFSGGHVNNRWFARSFYQIIDKAY